MNFKERQKELDNVKWYESMVEGKDKCGTYAFCGKCRKTDKYPCARAEERMQKGIVRIAILRGRLN